MYLAYHLFTAFYPLKKNIISNLLRYRDQRLKIAKENNYNLHVGTKINFIRHGKNILRKIGFANVEPHIKK